MHFTISSRWLYKSWCKLRAFDVLPQCTIKKDTIKTVVFVKGGVAMRICETSIEPTISEQEIGTTFIVTNAMRGFVARIKGVHSSLTMDINIPENTIIITLESVASALKYTFENVYFDEEKIIEPDAEDIIVKAPWQDLKLLCSLAPSLGKMTINGTIRKRAGILKHEGGRWTAAIQFKEKLDKDVQIVCDSEAMRRLCILFNTDASFISVGFLKNGVLKWSDNRGLSGYIAPVH